MRRGVSMKYCSKCGATLKQVIPPGDDRIRSVCDACHTVHYVNPKMVVGCIPEWENQLLLCRRAIEPRLGLWTIPAGFLETGETLLEAAKREALEEALAEVEILTLYTLFDIPHISQVYLIFRARLLRNQFGPGEESHEVKLFREEDIPWNDLAFTSVRESLRLYFEDRQAGIFPLHMGRLPSLDKGHPAMTDEFAQVVSLR
jgi:ADP-ribose pyrophosphatase YjhB (NUDIX family)